MKFLPRDFRFAHQRSFLPPFLINLLHIYFQEVKTARHRNKTLNGGRAERNDYIFLEL
jgi:hypothetical protein